MAKIMINESLPNTTNTDPSVNATFTHNYTRKHSAWLVSASQNWALTIRAMDGETLVSSYATWCEMLRVIAGEASYLGFPRVARLCRLLHGVLENQLIDSKPFTKEQLDVFEAAARKLSELVVEPHSASINVPALAQNLRVAFDLSESDLSKSIPQIQYFQEAASRLNHPGVVHSDWDVYRSARLDTLDRCIEEESWIVSQLAALAEDLASGVQSQHPAQRVMKVLRSHRYFHQVDRVCLAGRVHNTNQLMVVDSSTSDRFESNLLKPGYSCFVNPEGSLFSMKPGTMRIFADSERVLESFATSGKPAQRSIALINDMGLRSGLCLAIGRDKALQGFLFLNSCQTDLFRDITLRYAPLISLLGLVGTIALDSNSFGRNAGLFDALDSDLPKMSMLFDEGEFRSYLYRALQKRVGTGDVFSVSTDTSMLKDDFLYLPALTCGTLAEVAMRLHLVPADGTPVSVFISQEAATTSMGIRHQYNPNLSSKWDWIRKNVDLVGAGLENTPMELHITEGEIRLQFPFEPVLQSHRGLRYSVVY